MAKSENAKEHKMSEGSKPRTKKGINTDFQLWNVRDIPCNCSVDLPEVKYMGYNFEGIKFYFCRTHRYFLTPPNQTPVFIDRTPQIFSKTKAQISFME